MPDINSGYTFSAGETVTHTKLNSAASGAIDPSFYTGKSTLGSYSGTNSTVIVYDSNTGTFKKGTLQNVVFNNDELIKNRTALTTPSSGHLLLCQDPSGGMFKITRENLFYQWLNFAGMLDANGALGNTSGSALKVLADAATLEVVGNVVRVKDGGITEPKLADNSVSARTFQAVPPSKIKCTYDSGWIPTAILSSDRTKSYAHALAAVPGQVDVWFRWISAAPTSYDINEAVSLFSFYMDTGKPLILTANSTNIILSFAQTAASINLLNKSSLESVNPDMSAAQIRIVARLTEQTGI